MAEGRGRQACVTRPPGRSTRLRVTAALAAAGIAVAASLIISAQGPAPGPPLDAAQLQRWAEHGFSPDAARRWIETGTPPAEARAWTQAGIEFAGWASQWKERGFSPDEAGAWARAKVNVYTAGDFRDAGFSIAEARAWIDEGIQSALRAREFRERRFSPAEAGEWWRLKFFFPEDAAAWRDEGLDPRGALSWQYGEQEVSYAYDGSKITSRPHYSIEWARSWKSAGFSPAEARLAGAYDVPLEEAVGWLEAGFTFEEGVAWKDAGFGPAQAATLKAAGLTAVDAEEKIATSPDTDAIASLHSDLVLRPDATVDVTETIVLANAVVGPVERCFARKLPSRVVLRRSRSFSNTGWPSYRNLSVLHNGAPAAYALERTRSGDATVCVGAGEGDSPLAQGLHTFTFRYTTDDRLIDLHDQDRFFFDVTGQTLNMPVRRASATVHLPKGANTVRADGFAGPRNRRYFVADVRETADGDAIRYRVTRPLKDGMGFAVAVHLTRGFARPGLSRKLRRLDRESGGILSSLLVFGAGLAAALAYFIVAWYRVGRDPKRGVIVPIYEPPRAMSPALMRYLVTRRRVDDRSVAATLVRLAQCGALVIREREGYYRIEQTAVQAKRPEPHEMAFRDALFAADPKIGLGSTAARRRLRLARRVLRRALRAESAGYVTRNRGYFLPGLALSVVAAVAAIARIDPDIANDVPKAVLAFVVTSVTVLNLAFWSLLKAPTPRTRKLLDEIEGFRRFLDASYRTPSGHGSITTDLPPAVAVHLPYAIALALDTERASILDRRLEWYEGRSGGFSVGDFTRSLGRATGGVVTA